MTLSSFSVRSIRRLATVVQQRYKPANFPKMSFHFGTKEYTLCFLDLPQPDTHLLRTNALHYLDSFDPQLWYDDPIVSLLYGQKLRKDNGIGTEKIVDTKNALGQVNGRQILACTEQVEALKQHIQTYQTPYHDLRPQIRKIEEQLLAEHSGFLIGNQCIDFQKQDGITEIEEAIMANAVERRLNDLLLKEEATGSVLVNRKPVYVSCVSNFTNFLDLSRKTLRSLEVGIPCIILGRSNTSQHSYRWTQLLCELLHAEGIDPGMLTFLSCSLEDIKDITQSCQEHTGNLYTTCSRLLAAEIKSGYPNTVASTGGPNTLVATQLTDKVKEAIQISASIESSGQCTALRHCVVPPTTEDNDILGVFDRLEEISEAPVAVRKGAFDGVFAKHQGTPEPSDYTHHKSADAFIKIGDDLPAPGINEFWRKVVVDFSRIDPKDEGKVDQLAAWLNENQPISLAFNAPRQDAMKLCLSLFDKTSMVVYTVGSSDTDEMPPALTCQARPQEAECFGEFPPRKDLNRYTKFPVVVPSSNPSYDTVYSPNYLQYREFSEYFGTSAKTLLKAVKDDVVRGYCTVLIEYLQDATHRNPKLGFGESRTTCWGLQRPPLGSTSYISCSADATWDDVVPIYILFHVTTARDQVELSIDPQNKDLIAFCESESLRHSVETEDAMMSRLSGQHDVFNIVHAKPMTSYPMAGQFVSLYLPLGHIKSTMPNDQEFILRSNMSDKWLTSLF